MDRKKLKAAARKNLRAHYLLFVVTLLIAAFLGTSYSDSLQFIKAPSADLFGQETTADATVELDGEEVDDDLDVAYLPSSTLDAVYEALLAGDYAQGSEIATNAQANEASSEVHVGGLELAYRRGALSLLAGTLSTGTFLLTIFAAIQSIVGSASVATGIFIILSVLVALALSACTVKVYQVAFLRVFLEARVYEEVPASRFLFLVRVRKWLHAAWALLVTGVLQLLWSLTIVGAPIKRYAYLLVPYLLAENPSLKALDAITLSRKMMYGHKWECFKLEFSFFGWILLSACTLGLVGVFYANPYREATFAEYYVHVRSCAKEAGVEGVEALGDRYLYTKASEEQLRTAYADVAALKQQQAPFEDGRGPVGRFFADVLGVVLRYDKQEDAYRRHLATQGYVSTFNAVVAGKTYPNRLYPLPASEQRLQAERLWPRRHYSVCALIAVFFALSIFGWGFEVLMHFITDGEFVNRGVMHGPWLPIYGTGAVVFLMLLNRFRDRPALLFLLAVVVAGIIEYSTSAGLEMTAGQKWWDYSGYFLNLNGRICAEGLITFGLGGLAIVYLIAPLIDDGLRHVDERVSTVACVLLLVLFCVDAAVTAQHPNTGTGVTDIGVDASLEAPQG